MSLNRHTPARARPNLAATDFRVSSVPTLRARDRVAYVILVLLWTVVNTNFWIWWLRPEHVEAVWLYWPFTLALAYAGTLLTTVYLYFIGHMRQPVWQAPESGLKVALIHVVCPRSRGHGRDRGSARRPGCG